MMHPYNEPDRIEKTFLTVGTVSAAVLITTIVYSLFFLQ